MVLRLQVPESQWDAVRSAILDITASSSRSSKPAIYGMVAAAEVRRLRPLSGTLAQNDAAQLELAAAEMAQAAADLVSLEREIVSMTKSGQDANALAQKEAARSEVRCAAGPPGCCGGKHA
jgi:alpha-amylase